MTGFSLDLEGFEQALEEIDRVIDDVDSDAKFTVGTGVEYSIYLEAGTSDMDPKPFFQPALSEVRQEGVDGFVADNTRLTVDALDTVTQVLKVLVLALERRIKEIITTKGLIDTGTLRASVVAIPGDDPTALPGESEFSGFDSDNPAPESAGRALTETVEINV